VIGLKLLQTNGITALSAKTLLHVRLTDLFSATPAAASGAPIESGRHTNADGSLDGL